jgi:hypothetical protein
MHDPARQEREGSRDNQRANENAGHSLVVLLDLAVPRMRNGKREHHQRKDRQQMDRIEPADQLDLMDSA